MSRSIAARPVQVCLVVAVVAAALAAASLALGNGFSGRGGLPQPLPQLLGPRDRSVSVAVYRAPAEYKRVDRDICDFPVETHEVGTFETLLFRRVSNGKLVRIERGVTLRVTFTNVATGKSVAGSGYRQQTLVPNVSRPETVAGGLTTYHWHFNGLSLLLAVPTLGPVSLATGTEDVYFKLDRRGRFVSYYGAYDTPPWPGTYFDQRLCQFLT